MANIMPVRAHRPLKPEERDPSWWSDIGAEALVYVIVGLLFIAHGFEVLFALYNGKEPPKFSIE